MIGWPAGGTNIVRTDPRRADIKWTRASWRQGWTVWAAGLAALGLVALTPGVGRGQIYPGEGPRNPIPPARLSQVNDHELALLSFERGFLNGGTPRQTGTLALPRDGSSLYSETPTFTVDAQSRPGEPVGSDNNRFDRRATARGRFVDPARDTIVVLAKKENFDQGHIEWTLQEIAFSFSDPHPPFSPGQGTLASTGVPRLDFTGLVPPSLISPGSSPGAIAAGDLDQLVDAQGAFHDEIAVLTENKGSLPAALALSVISYGDIPGQATIHGPVYLPLPYAYLPSACIRHGCSSNTDLYPGPTGVAIGDFHGTGQNEIAAVAAVMNGATPQIVAFFYRYYPAGASSPLCAAPCLALVESVVVDQGKDVSAYLARSSLEAVAADVDGDGTEELLVLWQNDNRPITPFIDTFLGANLNLAVIARGADPTTLGRVLVQQITDRVQPWSTESDVRQGNFHDIRLTAGQFQYDPTASFPLNQRQVALGYKPIDASHWSVETWSIVNTDSKWAATWSKSRLEIEFCGGVYNSLGLEAGNWVGTYGPVGTPSLAGLALSYETRASGQAPVQSLALAQVDSTSLKITPTSPLRTFSTFEPENRCGAGGGGAVLVAFDVDGDSLRVGAPVHLVLSQINHYDYVLQEPPKHLDYRPDLANAGVGTNGILNVSRFKDFGFGYANKDTTTTQTTTSKATTFQTGGGTTADARATVGPDLGPVESSQVTLDFSFKLGGDHESNNASYTGAQKSYSSQLSHGTSTADALSYQTTTSDIWRYPLYGTKATVPDDPSALVAYYEITLPRAACDAADADNGTSCPTHVVNGNGVDGYQPWHVNGSLLSYAACGDAACSASIIPPDLGGWRRPTPAQPDSSDRDCRLDNGGGKTTGCTCVPDPQDPKGIEICQTPLSNAVSFGWPNESTQTITLDTAVSSGTSRSWSNDVYFSTDFAIGGRVGSNVAGTLAGCFDLHYGLRKTWSGSSSRSVASTNDLSFTLRTPSTGEQSIQYTFQPTLYTAAGQPIPNKKDDKRAAGDPPLVGSTLKLAHAVGIDASAGNNFWAQAYAKPDPAVGLPLAFDTTDGGTSWVLNPRDDAKQLRGFLTLVGNPTAKSYRQPLAGPPKVGDAVLKNQVLIQARVYNLSVGSQVANILARFDIVQVDALTGLECTDATSCLTRRVLPISPDNPNPTIVTCYNPYNLTPGKAHPQNCDTAATTTLPARGIGLAEYTLDISQLGPRPGSTQVQYRIYVIVDPEVTIDQTHGWHQPRALLRPANPQAGDTFTVDIFQGQAAISKVTYVSQGALSDVLPGLVNALSKNATIRANSLTVTCVFPSLPPPPCVANDTQLVDGQPQIVIAPTFGANAEKQFLKPSTEFRSGFLVKPPDLTSGLYFVPSVSGACTDSASCAGFVATSDLPGQNNEGWGLLTVLAPSATLLGDSPIDPCRSSSLDLFAKPGALAAVDQDRVIRSDVVRARPAQSLRIRFTGSATDHTFAFENAELFVGHPDAPGAELQAARHLHGIDRDHGGVTWFNWRTPPIPGVYELYAQVVEPTSDAQPGNNLARLEVVVAPDDNTSLVGVAFRNRGDAGRARAHVAGTRTIDPGFDLRGTRVTIWNLLNEAGGTGELVRGGNNADSFPVTLLGKTDRNGKTAVFETPAGASPHVRLQLKTQGAKKARSLDFSVQVDDATMPEAALCSGQPRVTDLVTSLTIEGGGPAPVVVTERRPWRCLPNGFRTAH